jgi:hypothetical protein
MTAGVVGAAAGHGTRLAGGAPVGDRYQVGWDRRSDRCAGWCSECAHRWLLRGTPSDPFGMARVRRSEQFLEAENRGTADQLDAQIDASSYARAVAMAASAELVRGYEDVKLAREAVPPAQRRAGHALRRTSLRLLHGTWPIGDETTRQLPADLAVSNGLEPRPALASPAGTTRPGEP